MLVRPDERAPVARLLRFLQHGEMLARDCAQAQAALAPDEPSRRFLLRQSRQEAFHAVVFQGAIAWLAPRHLRGCPLLPPLERYRDLIEDAIGRRDFAETLLAEQVILEGLGEAILARIEAGLAKREAPLGRLRQVLLLQEEAHHGFGRRTLDRMVADGRVSRDVLSERGLEYARLAQMMVESLADLFASVDEDAAAWAADAASYLPDWLATP